MVPAGNCERFRFGPYGREFLNIQQFEKIRFAMSALTVADAGWKIAVLKF